jgi:hypothetical protein
MRGRAETKKREIISGLANARRKILDEASSLSPARQDEIFLGVWSVKDLLAHLVGWDYTNIQAAKEIMGGELPSFYAHHDRDWKTYNEGLVAQYKKDSFQELVSSVEDSHHQLIDFLEKVPAEELTRDRGLRYKGYKVTIARLLEAETKDEIEHHRQIREFARGTKQAPFENS